MEISWNGNVKQKVRQAWLAGKHAQSIWLRGKKLYPDGNTSSILALRPMSASLDWNYPPWAWLMHIMKEKDYYYYEMIVENGLDVNGGQDFVVGAKGDWSDYKAEDYGWSGCFDPETFLLECKTDAMRVWAGMKKEGDRVKVKLRCKQLYQEYWDLHDELYRNPNHVEKRIDLPYVYSAQNMEGEGFDGVSQGLNFRFREKSWDNLFFNYNIRVSGIPSGKTHIYGELVAMLQSQTLLISGSMWQRNNQGGGIAYWNPYSDYADFNAGWFGGDTGMLVTMDLSYAGQNAQTNIEMEIAWPAWPPGGEYLEWNSTIDKIQL